MSPGGDWGKLNKDGRTNTVVWFAEKGFSLVEDQREEFITKQILEI